MIEVVLGVAAFVAGMICHAWLSMRAFERDPDRYIASLYTYWSDHRN